MSTWRGLPWDRSTMRAAAAKAVAAKASAALTWAGTAALALAGTIALPLALSSVMATASYAQSGGAYNLTWNKVSGGGSTTASGGSLVLGGTVGQPDADPLHNLSLVLAGGFWQALLSTSGVGSPPPGSPTTPGRPLVFQLHAATPNPTAGSAAIAFDLPSSGSVRLAVYNILGARVRTLVGQTLGAGSHLAVWNGTDESGHRVSGVFYVRLEAGRAHSEEKLSVLR